MRDEAPLYYDEERGLLRADPARGRRGGVQGPRVASRRPAAATSAWCAAGEAPQKSIIFMDPPDHRHMRSLLNKAFTPRAIQSQTRDGRRARSSTTWARPTRTTSTSCRTSPARSPSRSSPGWPGCPRTSASRSGTGSTTSLQREPGQIEIGETGHAGQHRLGRCTTTAWCRSGAQNPQDDMISRLIAAEIPGEDGEMRKLDDIEITGFTTLLGGAGAETVTKLVGSAVVDVRQASRAVAEAARRPQQDPGRRRGTAALRRPGAVQRALQREGRRPCPAAPSPRTSRCS